jgi:hypothetical protein
MACWDGGRQASTVEGLVSSNQTSTRKEERGDEKNAHLSLLDLTQLLIRRLDLLALVLPEAADELAQISSLQDLFLLRNDVDQPKRDLKLPPFGFGSLDFLHNVRTVEDPGIGRARGVVGWPAWAVMLFSLGGGGARFGR